MKQNIRDIYTYFLVKLYNQGNVFIEDKLIDSFLKDLSKFISVESLNEDFVWSYFSFQFAYWSQKKTRFANKIYHSWVLGSKAIERWFSRSKFSDYHVQQFLDKRELDRPIKFCKVDLREKFEEVRKRDLNTPQGFLNCFLDSCYSESSEVCKKCDYVRECKSSL